MSLVQPESRRGPTTWGVPDDPAPRALLLVRRRRRGLVLWACAGACRVTHCLARHSTHARGMGLTGDHVSDSERTGQPIEIRDRRELPFFQVRLRALRQIRSQVDGPRRVRTVGFYALICQIANEQRHTGQHRTVQITYEQLAHRSGAGRSSIRRLLDVLCAARVIDYGLVNDPTRAAPVGVMQLLIHDDPWEAITVAMANEIARPRLGGHVLRDLGLVTKSCSTSAPSNATTSAGYAQRSPAATSRLGPASPSIGSTIATASSSTAESSESPVDGVRGAGATSQTSTKSTRRRAAESRAENQDPAGRKTGTGRAEDWDRQGRGRGPAEPHARTARAENEDWQGGHSADVGPAAPPSTTCAGDGRQRM